MSTWKQCRHAIHGWKVIQLKISGVIDINRYLFWVAMVTNLFDIINVTYTN